MNIPRLQESYRGFYITAPEGNNAFSYDKRSCKKIYVPPLIKGDLQDIKAGQEVVFSDIVDAREINALGLQHFVHIVRPGQDIFIFDNHNHAFAFWAAGIQQGVIPQGASLVHVDQHKDTREPVEWFVGHGTFEACHYANHILNVGNFIPPALKAGWFKEVVQAGSTEAFPAELKGPFVLDIDLDIFAPIMAHIPEDVKISRLRGWLSRASFITIATSPFFMDQNQALHYVRRLI
jgi:hypothetical protein